MPIAAPLIIGAATVGAAAIGADAAKSAASKQSDAAANALAQQKAMFNATQENFQPYLGVGKGATYTLGSLYGIGPDGSQTNAPVDYSAFYSSPDYAFAKEQGNLALERAQNARGMNLSGGALKDIAQFNQGLATQQFGNYYNRLLSLSQIGQQAASGASGAAQNFSGQMANSIQAQGQAQASGLVGAANAWSGGINSGISNSLLYNALNRSSYAQPGGSQPVNGYGTNPYVGDYGPTLPGWGG